MANQSGTFDAVMREQIEQANDRRRLADLARGPADSSRWCRICRAHGDHHTDRHTERSN